MGLGFGGSRTDRGPAYHAGDVLGDDGVKHLRGGGDTHFRNPDQQTAGFLKTGVDIVTAVEPGIVDQSFPTHIGAGLFKVDPHHQQHGIGNPFT